MTEFICNGYHCEQCGTRVRVMKLDSSKTVEVPSSGNAVSACPKCGAIRLLSFEEILALPLKWTSQE